MTQTVCITGFTYAELDQDAKYRVGHWFNDDRDLWEEDKDYWQEQLEALGYADVDFRFSGFYSQGDGASIACSVDAVQFIKRHKLGNKYRSLLYWLTHENVTRTIDVVRSKSMRYVHQYMIDANADSMIYDLNTIPQINNYQPVVGPRYEYGELYNPNFDWSVYDHPAVSQANQLAAYVLEEVREQSMRIYRVLQDEYESWFTDEVMIENCEANEYVFDNTGRPIHHMRIAA